MSQERNNYYQSFEQEEQRSIEFTEYPELHRYYSSRMKSEKKPKSNGVIFLNLI